jgi:RND superfamily putative drug exporter
VAGWCIALAALAGLYGRGLFDRLGAPALRDPHSPSTREAELEQRELGDNDPDLIALWRPPGRRVDDPKFKAALATTLDRVKQDPSVARVLSAAGPQGERFYSKDKRATFAVVSLRGDARARLNAVERLRPLLAIDLPSGRAAAHLGGLAPTGRALTRLAARSLERGEEIAMPVTALLLLIIFRSAVAALLPLVIGGLGIIMALALLTLLSHVMAVDAFAVNVVTILGLGVSIDYALFIVARYREERAKPGDALCRAITTAGRSVLFSGITVAASLSGLFVFRQPFLRSLAVGGIAVTLLAATLALVVLPALLSLLGDRLDRGRLPWIHRKRETNRPSFWFRLSTWVIRHRVPVCIGVTIFLLLLAAPFRRLRPGRADVRSLPVDSEPRRVAEALEREFPSLALFPDHVLVTFDDDVTRGLRMGDLWDYTEKLKQLPGVERVESILSFAGVKDRDAAEELGAMLAGRNIPELRNAIHGPSALVRVVPTDPPDAPSSRARVLALRAVPAPPKAKVLVGGQAATLVDFVSALRTHVPWMLALVGAAMFVILFIAFRSVVLPIEAMIMTTFSLTASFGASVFIFQDGRLEGLLHYQSLGTTEATLPVVMFAVIFGLSMDYEVLILSRIRECRLAGCDDNQAIVAGLTHTGSLVTGAALLMLAVFSAFAAAPLTFVKALGLGMGLAVALDATVVRMLLVPSTMALLGRANWWSPDVRRVRLRRS